MFLYEYQIVKETGWTVQQVRDTPSWWLMRLTTVMSQRAERQSTDNTLERIRKKK